MAKLLRVGNKIKFRLDGGRVNEGYIYKIQDEKLYVSQNKPAETIGFAQNWIISKEQVIENLTP